MKLQSKGDKEKSLKVSRTQRKKERKEGRKEGRKRERKKTRKCKKGGKWEEFGQRLCPRWVHWSHSFC